MTDTEIELIIQEKGLTAPRLTPEWIDGVIIEEDYHHFKNTNLTVCCLILKNGFAVTGESYCVSAENFNQELGQQIARKNAVEKIWMFEGYLLKEYLYENS